MGKNATKNTTSTVATYEDNITNIHCQKISNMDILVRTQFENFLCDKHDFNLQKR